MIEPEVSTTGFDRIREAFARQTFFEDKTWRYSPSAIPLPARDIDRLEKLGNACLEFHRALDLLYQRSSTGRNLLRNRPLTAPWVADYYDRGKPAKLVAGNRSETWRGALPPVFRPDLLVTEDGFALTEFDSVPGGIGLTAFLNRLYAPAEPKLVGSDRAMIDGFYENLRALAPSKTSPLIAIVVSEESAVYFPEMAWLADQCREVGKRVFCLRPEEVFPLGNGLFFDLDGNPEKIDVIHRFFELYDLENVPNAEYIVEAMESGETAVSPPFKTIFEEKLSLALYHHHLLGEFWAESLSKSTRRVLDGVIPKSWIIDPAPLPPGAVYVGPEAGGRPINDWRQLAEASQKERDLIVKISGFHESAEGARSVTYGRDSSREEWAAALDKAIAMSGDHPFIVQEYRKPVRRTHPLYDGEGRIHEEQGRLRICPYYFSDGEQPRLSGVLATFCPADKKIIHGMRDAAMLPCRAAD